MSVTDEYLENNRRYVETFSGPLPLPPSRHFAVVACMDARLDVYRITDDEIRSLATDVRQSIARIKASSFIPHKDAVPGFVFDVASGRLDEVL
jgi:carbonic anhydrase